MIQLSEEQLNSLNKEALIILVFSLKERKRSITDTLTNKSHSYDWR